MTMNGTDNTEAIRELTDHVDTLMAAIYTEQPTRATINDLIRAVVALLNTRINQLRNAP